MSGASRRLVMSGGVGALVAAAAAVAAPWQVAALGGWCAGAVAFLAQVAREVFGADPERTQSIATREDFSQLAADGVLIAAATASLIGVGFVLAKAGESSGASKGLTAGLGAVSVALAWVTLQTTFMLRYARLFHENPTGGIDFGADALPDYRDFAYVAFTIGMTFQVSDTAIMSREIRRTVLRHALLSFLFFTAFVAVLINVVGGLF